MDLSWITDTIAVSARPRGGDWLDGEVADLERQGIGLVVSCLTNDEEIELDLIGEAEAVSRQGLAFVRATITDMGTPTSRSRIEEVVTQVARHTAAGGRAAIHCRQGLGRAPLIAAAVLVRAGMTPEAAWARIAERRHRPVPETEQQREWIAAFAGDDRGA